MTETRNRNTFLFRQKGEPRAPVNRGSPWNVLRSVTPFKVICVPRPRILKLHRTKIIFLQDRTISITTVRCHFKDYRRCKFSLHFFDRSSRLWWLPYLHSEVHSILTLVKSSLFSFDPLWIKYKSLHVSQNIPTQTVQKGQRGLWVYFSLINFNFLGKKKSDIESSITLQSHQKIVPGVS